MHLALFLRANPERVVFLVCALAFGLAWVLP